MSEDRKPFTVNDRRHFTADGQVRAEQAEESPVPDSPAPAEPPPSREAASVVAGAQDKPVGPVVALSDLLIQLAGNASMLLGLAAPEGEEPQVDLEGAREVIGILEMLREKTSARRTPEEEKLLEGILYELRMSYVARSRVGGA